MLQNKCVSQKLEARNSIWNGIVWSNGYQIFDSWKIHLAFDHTNKVKFTFWAKEFG